MISALLCAELQITMFELKLSPSANWCVGGWQLCLSPDLCPQPFYGLLQVTWGENLPTSGLESTNVSEGRFKTTFKGCSLHVCCMHVALGGPFMCSSAIEF